MDAPRRRLWLGLAALCGLHQVAARAGLGPAWADSWLDDLLCLPLVLGVTLMVRRVRGLDGELPLVHVVVGWFLFTGLFELVLPRLDAAYTADPLDATAYAAGAVFFQVSMNGPRREAVT